MKNKFYVFEGIDGSGKTTLINILKEKLINKRFFFTKEPCGTNFNHHMKELLHKVVLKNDYISQYLLFAAERSFHIKTIINEHLNNNYNVISDRFFHSSLVYQGLTVDENFIDLVYKNSNHGISINKIFFCNICPDIALKRIQERNVNDILDNYFKDKLYLLSKRYNNLFHNNSSVVFLDMTLPIDILIGKVLKEFNL